MKRLKNIHPSITEISAFKQVLYNNLSEIVLTFTISKHKPNTYRIYRIQMTKRPTLPICEF